MSDHIYCDEHEQYKVKNAAGQFVCLGCKIAELSGRHI